MHQLWHHLVSMHLPQLSEGLSPSTVHCWLGDSGQLFNLSVIVMSSLSCENIRGSSAGCLCARERPQGGGCVTAIEWYVLHSLFYKVCFTKFPPRLQISITSNETLLWLRDCEFGIVILDSSPVLEKDSWHIDERQSKDHFSEPVAKKNVANNEDYT